MPADDFSIPQNVLMTVDVVGGVWTYALELCRALSRFNVNVSLATIGPGPDASHRRDVRDLRNVQLYETGCKLEWVEQSERDRGETEASLLALAGRVRADLVHLNSYSLAALDWNVPVLVAAHSCLLSWWAAVKQEPAPAWFASYQRAVSRGLRNADIVVAPTRAMLNEVERYYRSPDVTAVIPNGRSARDFCHARKEDVILSAGRLWDEGKNIQLLDKIARRLPWTVYVAGDRTHPNGSLAAFDHLVSLGMLSADELRPWFSRASIYAAPARYEPFGLSILEAALSGCALVLGDIPSLRENWTGAALFAPPDEPRAFQSAILELIHDVPLCRRLAAAASTRALRFSPGAMAKSYLRAYSRAWEHFSHREQPVAEEARIA